ncbi:AMP-dependent synthetase [Nocardiopsis mangrovi]|uniref:AMP-dependent synthetase n=1 Tax=Nocardiopsis mangrovi TaxID=1179818 RepID=A0ABV9DQE2_9ACTN
MPVLTREDVNKAIDHLLRRDPGRLEGTLLNVTGGTMSEPRLGVVPEDMFLTEIRTRWDPLDPGDLLISLFSPGHMWSAHYFHNALGRRSGASTIPFETPDDAELGRSLDFYEGLGATALAATPDAIRRILRFCASTGRRLPWLHKLLWAGTGFDDATAELLSRQFPHVQAWGLYGSAETWMIGHIGPECARNTFHVLPHQHVEIDNGRLLLTTLHDDCVVPLIRYDIGVAGSWGACTCGREDRAIRVSKRTDSLFELLNQLVSPDDLVELALQLETVREAEVVLMEPDTENARMHLRVRLEPGVDADPYTCEWIRHHVVTGSFGLARMLEKEPELFEVVAVGRLRGYTLGPDSPALTAERA